MYVAGCVRGKRPDRSSAWQPGTWLLRDAGYHGAAGNVEDQASDSSSLLTGQERGGVGDVFGCAQPLERVHADHGFAGRWDRLAVACGQDCFRACSSPDPMDSPYARDAVPARALLIEAPLTPFTSSDLRIAPAP